MPVISLTSKISALRWEKKKLCLTYFKICQTYFKLSLRYFLRLLNGTDKITGRHTSGPYNLKRFYQQQTCLPLYKAIFLRVTL